MGWRWLRRGERPGPSRDAVIVAIDRLRRDQRELDARLGVAVVDAAVLERAVGDQRRLLTEALAQIRDALAGARSAADRAAADGDATAAAGYREAANGFDAQARAVEATRAQLERLAGGAAANLDRAHELLRRSAASLDRVLRDEVELLGRIERLDRARVIAAVRRPGEPG